MVCLLQKSDCLDRLLVPKRSRPQNGLGSRGNAARCPRTRSACHGTPAAQGPLLGPHWPIWKRLRITTSPPGLSASRRRTRRGLGEGSRIIPHAQRSRPSASSTRWLSGRPRGLGAAASAKPAPTASGSTSFVASQISFPGPPAHTSIDHLTPWRDKALTPVILNMARAIREEADPLGRARRFRMNP